MPFLGGICAPFLGVLLANALRNARRPALFLMLVPMRTLTVFGLTFAGALLYGAFVLAEELTPLAMMGAVIAMVGTVIAAWAYTRLDPRLDRFLEWLDTPARGRSSSRSSSCGRRWTSCSRRSSARASLR
jgi:hypothetical protein